MDWRLLRVRVCLELKIGPDEYKKLPAGFLADLVGYWDGRAKAGVKDGD